MQLSRLSILLTFPIAFLVALASAAGIFLESVYAKETVSWAAQGVGQDVVNLVLVFPALLVAGYLANKRSLRGLLVWLGLLLYIVYSYLLYAFFVHFNFLFPVYVATLGLSFYALLGSAISLGVSDLAPRFAANNQAKPVSIYLMIVGLLFGFLWLADILSALLAGRAPESISEVGLPVNPVHVLDLALLLPGMIVTSVLLRRRRPLGFLFAVPLMVFAAVMGVAIISMSIVMNARGVPASPGVSIGLGANVLISLYWIRRFLKETRP
jgi:hypothetical protein